MWMNVVDAATKRAGLRAGLDGATPLRLVGAFSPLVARMVEEVGFEAVYVSGGVLANDLGYPDIGLTTLSEVAARSGVIAQATTLPTIVDADTGFGGALSAARTVHEFERQGLAGCHLEDQLSPKRCGHLDGKQLVSQAEMVEKIVAAVRARRDPNFMVIARTDARAVEGLEGALRRGRAYAEAGADAIFCEAFASLDDYRAMRAATDVALLANLTEFGKTPLFSAEQLHAVGVQLVLYPVTTWRLAMGAVERGLEQLSADGNLQNLLPAMQTRGRLYGLLDYDAYGAFDSSVASHGYRDAEDWGG